MHCLLYHVVPLSAQVTLSLCFFVSRSSRLLTLGLDALGRPLRSTAFCMYIKDSDLPAQNVSDSLSRFSSFFRAIAAAPEPPSLPSVDLVCQEPLLLPVSSSAPDPPFIFSYSGSTSLTEVLITLDHLSPRLYPSALWVCPR